MTGDRLITNEEASGLLTPEVQSGAMWLADQPGLRHPVAEIRAKFSLSMKQSCDACALAHRFRTLRRAFG